MYLLVCKYLLEQVDTKTHKYMPIYMSPLDDRNPVSVDMLSYEYPQGVPASPFFFMGTCSPVLPPPFFSQLSFFVLGASYVVGFISLLYLLRAESWPRTGMPDTKRQHAL